MSDTQRTLAAALALLPVQQTRSIGAQALRDAVVSLAPGIAIASLSETIAVATGGVYEPASEDLTEGETLDFVTVGPVLRYTGEADRLVLLIARVSVTGTGAIADLTLNGARLNVQHSSLIMHIAALSEDDEIGFTVTRDDVGNVTIGATLLAVGIPS